MSEKNETRCERCGISLPYDQGKTRVVNWVSPGTRRGNSTRPVKLFLCPNCDRSYNLFFNWFFVGLFLLVVGMLYLIGLMN